MPKTNATEREQEESTKPRKVSGKPSLVLVEHVGTSTTSDFTLPVSRQRSHEDKSQQSFTGVSPVFSWQRFHAIAHELPPLFVEHWKELALNKDVVSLDPDWDRFYALDVQNVLRVLTVRMNDTLVGYAFLLVGPHLHYRSTLWGNVDMYWLSPEVRAGWTGVKLFKTLIRDAKAMGVVNLTLSTKHHFMQNRVTKLLQRLGFVPIETVHSMRL